ncbi:hypothetical protein ScPMuIL_012913 [Solemya velum]
MEKFLAATVVLLVVSLVDGDKTDVDSVCDGLCDCNAVDEKMTVTCHDRGFDHVPGGIPKHVTTLYLDRNQIEHIDDNAFDNLQFMKTLVLAGNKLARITSRVLRHLSSLTTIDYAQNVIETVAGDAFFTLPSVTQLNFDGNPLVCDCETRILKQWLKARHGVDVAGALCTNIMNLPLISLSIQYFADCVRNLFKPENKCQTCSAAANHEVCERDGMKQSCSGLEPVCFSTVKFADGELGLWKGCLGYASCILTMLKNARFCYNNPENVDCTYCCRGDFCNARDVGGRTKSFSLKMTFTLEEDLSETVLDVNSGKFVEMASQLKTQLEGIFWGRNGSFVVTIHAIRQPKTTVESIIDCTTISGFKQFDILEDLYNVMKSTSSLIDHSLITASIEISMNGSGSCQAETTKNTKGVFFWPKTPVGLTIQSACPTGNNSAVRMCGESTSGEPTWSDTDTSPCRQSTPLLSVTEKLRELANSTINNSNVLSVARTLLNVTMQTIYHTAMDVVYTIQTIEHLFEQEMTRLAYEAQDSIFETINYLLGIEQTTLIDAEEYSGAPSRLLENVDKFMSDVSLENGDVQNVQSNIALFAVVVKPTEYEGLTVVADVPPNRTLTDGTVAVIKTSEMNAVLEDKDRLSLPASLMSKAKNASRITFAVYRDDKIFSAIEQVAAASSGQRRQYPLRVNSRVIASSVAGEVITGLVDPVLIQFRHNLQAEGHPRCVYWVHGPMAGERHWKPDGCSIVKTTDNRTLCQCNHLTNFALLMDVYGTGEMIDADNRKALSILSYIGCSISLCGLVLTLLTYACFSKLRRNNPSKILVHLSVALTGTNLVFLLGMHDYTLGNEIGCKIVAVLMHFFLLSTMCWMAVEAFYMYVALVKVFNAHISRFLLKACLFGWGIPLLVVGATIGINKTDNYGYQTSEVCWMIPDAFYAAFLAPVAIVLALNFAIFTLVLRQLIQRSSKNLSKTDRLTAASRLRGAASFAVLLGLTWVFAFFAIGSASVVFNYCFTTFNSLQGLFIFIFHCFRKKDARQAWAKLLHLTLRDPTSSSSSNKVWGCSLPTAVWGCRAQAISRPTIYCSMNNTQPIRTHYSCIECSALSPRPRRSPLAVGGVVLNIAGQQERRGSRLMQSHITQWSKLGVSNPGLDDDQNRLPDIRKSKTQNHIRNKKTKRRDSPPTGDSII